MYRVLKEKGNNVNVTLENMETKASVIIGRITIDLLDLLEKAGHHVGDDGVALRDEWCFEVNEEIGKSIASKAMRMSKPIRDQSKKAKAPKKSNKEIDAMDVLLGLASYN